MRSEKKTRKKENDRENKLGFWIDPINFQFWGVEGKICCLRLPMISWTSLFALSCLVNNPIMTARLGSFFRAVAVPIAVVFN